MKTGIITRLVEYFDGPEWEKETAKAAKIFFKRDISTFFKQPPADDEIAMFEEWFLFDYKLGSRRTLLQEFFAHNPLELPENELKVYGDLCKSFFGIYEIKDINPGINMTLSDPFNGKTYLVFEKSGTQGPERGNLISVRLMPRGEAYEIAAARIHLLPVRLSDSFRKALLGTKQPLSFIEFYQQWILGRKKSSQNSKDPFPDISGTEARENLKLILRELELEKHISVETVEGWIRCIPEKPTEAEEFAPLTLLTGLASPKASQSSLEKLVGAYWQLYRTIPLKSLDGLSPAQKGALKPEMAGRSATLHKIGLPPQGAYQESDAAYEAMKAGKVYEAAKHYEASLKKLLDDRTVNSDIYRLFANAATAYLSLGNRELGVAHINWALELNPKYDFALDIRKRLESGEMDELIERGRVYAATHAFKDPELPANRWLPEKVQKMTTDEIVNKLIGWGISVDQSTFNVLASKHVSIEDFLQTHWDKYYSGPKEDEDFLFNAADVLWHRWCPERLTVDDLYELAYDLNDAVMDEREGGESVLRLLGALEKFITSASGGVWQWWKNNREMSDAMEELIETLVYLVNSKYRDRAVKIADDLWLKTEFELVKVVLVANSIESGSQAWKTELNRLRELYPHTSYPDRIAADFLMENGDAEEAKKILLKTLSRLEERESGDRPPKESEYDFLSDAYDDVLDKLIEIAENEKNTKLAGEYRNRQEGFWDRQDELESLSEPHGHRKDFDKIAKKFEEEMIINSPGSKYMEFLRQTGINFATENLTTSMRTVFGHSQNGAIGRNDPCPCGSGKKFKHCHGA